MKKRYIAAVAAVLAFGGCTAAVASGGDSPPSATTTGPASSSEQNNDLITYRVEGAGKATVMYQTTSGSTQKAVTLPWEVRDVEAGWANVTATRTSGSSKIECVIERGGVEIARTEAEGQYSSCSASGELFE